MKNKFCVFFLLIAIITVLILGIVVFLSLWSSFKCPDPGMMKVLDYFGLENDLCFTSGFAVNPYRTGSSDRDTAIMIGASVSYILREVKYFTLLIVVLTVLALNACSIIVYFIIDKIANPNVREEETTMDISDKENNRDNLNYYIEKQSAGMDRLSLEIDEMLAEINSLIERSNLKQKALVK
jgi:ABC-type transport system involved in multi-copper enzyme maturation permease subunit